MSGRPESPLEEAARWLGLAQDDLQSARTLLAHHERARRNVGFLAQQAAEKALKAVLVAHNLPVPRIHNLNALAASLPAGAGELDVDNLGTLTPWAVAGRYTTDEADLSREDAEALISAAARVLATCEVLANEAPSSSDQSDGA